MAINVGDNFSYQGKKYLDNRQSFKTLSELQAYSNVPEGFIAYCEEDKKRYEYVDGVWTEYVVASSGTEVNPDCATKAYVDDLIESHTHDEYLTEHQDISHLATKEEIPSIEGLATETYVQEQIANASLGGGEGGSIDTSNFATKDELNTKFDDVSVNEEETTDAQTALDFFANGEKVKTVYFSGGGGGSAAAAYISTTLPEEAMVETGYDFDILLDFYSPNPGKGTLKVFVNDVDALSTPILQGETTTTLSHEKLTKGTNKIVVYVLDRIGTMSNSLTFYVRYGSTELVGEFDSSLSYDYGANIRYYFTATALDTSLGLTFYMSIDGAVQNGVSCISDVRGYFTFPNSLEAGGHYCECWVEDSKGGKSNIETFNLVILDTNTLAIVTETRNPSVEEGSQLVLDYRVYKKNETTFIIKTYVDEELVSTGTCGLTTSYYKTTTLREGMHNIKIEAWDIAETVSDYITWSVIITPSTYTMLEPIKAGSMFMATAKNRTNGDPNRETWTGYNQDNNAIDCTLYNFAFNGESGWMDDQLFITGNSYVEVPIQPLANNARYGFTLDVEFSTKPIGVDDAEVLSLWNDTDNCGIKITTDQLILQSKTGNKCELYFSENEIVSAIFIIDRHEKTAKVYLNGVMCAAFALSDYVAEGVSYLEDFTVNGNLYLGKPGSNGYATIKNLRIYELALSSSEILNNFMANEIDKTKQKALVEFQKGADLPTVTVYCDFSGLGKNDKKYCDIVYNSPDPVKYGESFSLMGKYSQLQYQGTSSMQYPIKNYRLNPKDANGKVKIKLPNCQPETRFTLKADFMSSGHWQNTGLTKWINDNLYNYKEDDPKTMNPAKWWAIQNGKDPNDYRECIYGFPCRLILVNDGNSPLNEGQQEPTPGNTKDMGIFNFNLDKDCENSLGFKIKDFPNALSMEVTANSDTSAGAFMSYTSRVVDLPLCNHYDIEHISGNIPLESVIDNGTLNVRVENSDGNCVNGIVYFKDDSDTRLSSIILQPINSMIELTPPDGATKIMILLIRNQWGDGTLGVTKVHINDFTFNVIGSDSVVDPIIPTGDGELDYIKESFELRYPDEDDVPEGWGFMKIDGVEGGGLKSLIDWVDNSTDEQFVAEFEEHFHKDYTLRYFLLVMVLGMVDNLGKNMMLDSYDGKIWMPRFYDCDTICSYDNSGAIKFDVDIEMAQGYWNTSSSRLWTRVRDLFHDELVVKYNDMRQNGLSFESLMNVFYNEQIAKIPQKYYNMDADVKYLPYADEYLGKAHGDGYEHLKRWLKNRIIFTDSLYDYAPSYTNDMITFRANTTEEMTITIETYTPVYQHVSWYNGNMQKEKIAKGTQLTFKGFAQAATDQEVLVYGGSNIKRIIGISTMNPNSMLIGNATRLVELDISDCPILTDINSNKANFTPHTYLNKLDISNCPQLGGSLRLNYSPLIGEINAMNTAITDLQLPSSIRNLHTLKVPGALTNLTLNDGSVLSTLEFDGPNKLQSVNLTNCNALTNVVNFDMTQIPTVTLNNSYDADELYMSKTTNLSLVNMANIKKLIFVPNNEHETFNLTQLRNCPDYTVSAINCPSLKTFMTTAENRLSYKHDSSVKSLPYIPVEYIESDGSQYFITDYYANPKTKFVADAELTVYVNYMYVCGGRRFKFHFMTPERGFLYIENCTISPQPTTDIYQTRQRWTATSTLTADDPTPLHILCGYGASGLETNLCGKAKIYGIKIYEEGNLIKDYIPCINRINRIACLYDLVNEEFLYPEVGVMKSPEVVVKETAFCANTLDISNTKITDVNFLCTTDVYQLKLPDTVNNFICDSAYDLDTDYLPDGDFDTVHHELIEAYTTDYSDNVTRDELRIYRWTNGDFTFIEVIGNYNDYYTDYIDIQGAYKIKAYLDREDNLPTAFGYTVYDPDKNEILNKHQTVSSLGEVILPSDSKWVRFIVRFGDGTANIYKPVYEIYKKVTPNLIPSAADGSLIFSMYAPNTNVAVPAEGIWDLYGLTFEEFYTYGMNNDIVVTDGNITMPHRCADYNVTIQNANIKPTNHPTMLYPLLVNENKPIVGTIDYSDYQGDDISYAMAYANKSEVDISIPNDVAMNTQYFYNVDKESEYEYNDPRTIAKYTCNAKGVLPTFNSGYTAYKVSETDNGDGTYTTSIIADDIGNLPTVINFANKGNLLEVMYLNTSNINSMYIMFQKCSKLTKINTDNWDVSKVTNMDNMFENCLSLTSLDVSNWDVSSVKTFKSMFYNSQNLTSLDLSNWKTSSVTSMSSMFYNCSSLTSLDISGFKTSSLTNIQQMFYGCSSLTSLDFTGWNMSKINAFGQFCGNCTSLESVIGLNLSSEFNHVANDKQFLSFVGCSSLKTIKDIDVSFTVAMGADSKNTVDDGQPFWVNVAWKWFRGLNNLEDISFKGQVGLWDTLSSYQILVACDTSKFTSETWESFVSIFPETSTNKTIYMGKSQANLDAVPDSIKTALINKGYTLGFSN